LRMKPGENRSLLQDLPRLLLLGLGAVIVLAPYVWMFFASLKPGSEVFSNSLSLLPERFYAIENYGKALREVPMLRFLLNGVIVCALILFFQVLFAVPCAYALAKLRWRGREFLFGLVMLGLLIPYHVPALPLYVGFARLGLLDSFTALIAPSA